MTDDSVQKIGEISRHITDNSDMLRFSTEFDWGIVNLDGIQKLRSSMMLATWTTSSA